MAITVVLAIGSDPWLFELQRSALRSAGYFVTTVSTVDQSFDLLRSDFDIVLLGSSLSDETLNSITRSMRMSGSRVPVIRMADIVREAGERTCAGWDSGMLMNLLSERISPKMDRAHAKVA